MDFNEPAIAIGGYCRLDPASLNQTRHHLSQNRGAKSTKRRRKIISDDSGNLLNSTTTSASISSQNAIKLSKRSLSNKR
jgi:hypothetical protein